MAITAEDGMNLTATDVEVLVSIISVLVSWIGAAFIAGYRWGAVKFRLDNLEKTVADAATKDQLAGVKEDVAEIKGMFRMTIKDP